MGGKGAVERRATNGRRGLGGDQVEGRHAVRELLDAGRRPVRNLFVAEGQDESASLDEIEELARRRRVRVERVSPRRLESIARTDAPQGVVALAAPVAESPLEDLCRPTGGGPPFLVVLDGVTDPHNLGAVLRSAESAGASGAVLPRHRAVHLTPTAAKAAAGAIEHLPIAVVAGIPSALRQLAGSGVWTIGLAGESRRTLWDTAFGDDPLALVVGSEGTGLSALVRRRCDELVSIPHRGKLRALNVSAAAAVACFEVARRRSEQSEQSAATARGR